MSDSTSFADLMSRLGAGDEEAAALVFRRFVRRLLGLACGRLDLLLRRKVDPEDVVQSVFKSFFARQAERPYELDNWDSLWGLLARITLFKCGAQHDYFHAARRDVRRDAAVAEGDLVARDPTPTDAAVMVDLLEALLRELSDRDRHILTSHLQGGSVREVSAEVGCSERTVQRVLCFLQERLEERCARAGRA